MPSDLTIELSETELADLCALAKQNDLSVEEQAARIIEAHFDAGNRNEQPEVSIAFLRQNVDAVLDAVERGPVRIRAENGRVFVIMRTVEYDQLSASE